MTLLKKAIRTMLANKARYIGSVLLLMISSMMFVMTNTTSINLNNTFSEFSSRNALSDAEFSIDFEMDAAALGGQFAAKVELAARRTAKLYPAKRFGCSP